MNHARAGFSKQSQTFRRLVLARAGRETFTAKKNFVWTCNKETKEQASNMGNVVAIMRITDLKA